MHFEVRQDRGGQLFVPLVVPGFVFSQGQFIPGGIVQGMRLQILQTIAVAHGSAFFLVTRQSHR